MSEAVALQRLPDFGLPNLCVSFSATLRKFYAVPIHC
jgi:hypothetical protein